MRGIFADPVFLVLLILVVGLFVGMHNRVLGSGIVLLGAITLYLLATPFVADRLYRFTQTDWTTEPTAGDTGAIVVLPAGIISGAPEYGGDTVDGLSLQRVRYAAKLQRATGLPIMVTGGLPKKSTISTGDALRQVLVDEFGVTVAWVENAARNTEQHAVNCAAILRKQEIASILLVTHAAHMPRAQKAFERAGLTVTPAPTVFAETYLPFSGRHLLPGTRALFKSWYALHEIVGGIWYRVSHG